MSNKIKVLHLFPEFLRGGSPVNTLRFVKASQNELVHYAAGKKTDPNLFEEYPPWAEPLDIDLTGPRPGSFLRLWKEVRRIKPDVIHLNGKAGCFYGWLLSFVIARRIKMFLTLRGYNDKFSGIKSKFYRYLEGSVSRRVGRVISVSPSEREHYLSQVKADPAKVQVVPNGIDIHDQELPCEIEAVRKEYAVNIVSLSRITPQKDLVSMIEAFSLAAGDRRDAALHIMGGLTHGEEEYRKQVEAAQAASPAGDRIFFWGDVKQAGNLISYFDIYFSTALFEGLPTAVVEAFLSSVPVVGTDCIGNVDLIRSGETGYLTKCSDSGESGRALQEAISALGSEAQKAMVERARKEALNYSVENQARRLLALYTE